jgi:hypothetical protein
MSTIRLPTGRATHGISGKKTVLPQNLLRAFCIEAIKKTLTRVNQISLSLLHVLCRLPSGQAALLHSNPRIKT